MSNSSRSEARRRLMDLSAILVAFATLSALSACGGDPEGTQTGTTHDYGLPNDQLITLQAVDTSLSADKTVAGVLVKVACVGTPGDVVIPNPTFEVAPAEATSIEGDSLVIDKAGAYTVACTIGLSSVRDESPANLLVVPAAAMKITAAVAPAKVAGGEKATITCTGEDAFGNDVAKGDGEWDAAVDPSDLGDIDALGITGKKAGKGTVNCEFSHTAEGATHTAADFEVVAGKPHRTIATVEPAKFTAGGGAKVTCTVEDVAGNKIGATDLDFTVTADADLTVDGKNVTTTKSGKYEVRCQHKEATAEQTAAVVTVDPEVPVSWVLVPKPAKEPKPGKFVYKSGETIKLYGLGKDKYDNDVKNISINPPAAWTPTDGITPNGDPEVKSYTLDTDGLFTFTASLLDFPALGSKSVDILVDSTGPLVLISEPERASTRDGVAKFTVKGTVIDELSGVKSFTLNEQVLTVAGDGSFEMETEAAHAMNALIWKAEDEWENKSNGVQTYYYSTKWYDMDFAKPEKAFVNDGIAFWMSQAMIDNPPHDHKNPHDLATVIEIFLGSMDLSALIGQGIPIDQAGFKGQATFDNLKMGDKTFNNGYPEVSITVIDGGMHMIAKIHNFSMDVGIEGKLGIAPIPKQTATIAAKSIEISFDMMLSINEATGEVTSTAKDVDVNFVGMSIQLKGVLGFLSNWLLTAIQPVLTPLFEAIIKDQIGKVLSTQLGAAFSALALNQEMEIPPLIGEGDPVKVKLKSRIGQMTFFPTKVQNGGIIFGMDASMTAENKVPYKPLGSLARAGCLVPGKTEVFNPGQKFPLEIGLADDFVNELLWAIWNGGLLKLAIGAEQLGSVDLSQFGVSDLSVETDFMLPPVFTSCLGDGTVKLQMGDLKLHAVLSLSGKPVDVWMFVTMQATVEIKGVENPKTGATEIGFSMKEIDFVELEVDKINDEAKNLEGLFVSLIKDVMMPKLLDGLGSSLGSFPLPAIDLSSISPDIPKGTKLELEIKNVANEDGYAYLRGNLK